ncbi:MAG TPA: class I SAM-dependent methyltransferase [Terrimicrobiaceae bacterium]
MRIFVRILFAGLGLFLLVSMIWRFASGRRSLPCPAWLRWFVELDNPFTKTNRAATIIEHLDLQPEMVVLDFGCGPGRVAVPLAKRVHKGEVVAVDIQAGMLQRTREKAEQANVTNIRFVRAGAGEGKLERDHFDRAVLVTVLGEIPDQRTALKEVFDALKPGGILSVTEIIFDPHFQSRGKVTQLAEAVGFQECGFFGNRIAYNLNLEKPSA